MRNAIFSFYGSNVSDDVINAQREVVEKYKQNDTSFLQIKSNNTHGANINFFVRHTDYDNYLILDIDCIPLTDGIFPTMFKMASDGSVIGCAQRANHINNNKHIYAGPCCLSFSKKTYHKIGMPSFESTNRGDVAEEITYKCQEKGVNVYVIWPSHVAQPKWDLINDIKFGIGTTYSEKIYHQYEIRHGSENERIFIEKCHSLLR